MVQNRVFVSMCSGAMFLMSAMSILSLTSYWLFFFTTEELKTVPLQLLQLTLYLFDLLVHVAGSACAWGVREEDQNPILLHSVKNSALGVSVVQIALLLFQTINVGEGGREEDGSLLPISAVSMCVLLLCVQLWKLDQFQSRRHMMNSALLLLSISSCLCIGEFVSSLSLRGSLFLTTPGEMAVRGLVALILLSISAVWIFDPFLFPKREKSGKEKTEGNKEEEGVATEEGGLNGITSRKGLELIHCLHLIACCLSMITGAQIGLLQLGAASFVGSCIEIKRVSVQRGGETKEKPAGFHVDMFYRLPVGQTRDLSISF